MIETGLTGPELIIWQNTSGSPHFSSASFISILHEDEVWDEALYWQVDKALVLLADKYQKHGLPRDLMLAVHDFQNYVYGRLCFHEMPQDGSSIENLNDEHCQDWSERLNAVVRAALGGYSIDNGAFELVNPLI